MKKLVISLFAAVLMTIGLQGVSTSTAHADPYTGTAETIAKPVDKKIVKNKKVKFIVAAVGNVISEGATAKIVCKTTGLKVKKVGAEVKDNNKVAGPRLKKTGKWKCKIKVFNAQGDKTSKGKFKIKVVN